MIELTRLNGSVFVLNADLIETIEATPDTVISLVTGKKYVVREKVAEVIDRIVEFRRKTGVGKILIGNLEKGMEE
ncbi:MAG: flagellar FlbD family protein [Candidatus Caldatribacterium sp.]|uniref:flagellar FlbD family protein n=1 Tax=Candidatus Caldatribacterium sp. TaxID=2282143 RepID=UPI002992E825|nr:flagellar FlbD family protein [Candidatus Caldatribacterium sp.]MCX7731142.1 flagellar FlbD family protein [Candidatus Caldatribacterium sp.]MDW8081001.1 flagellar FlbD family protein [Candidatus Calescibacterium sp.]